MSTLLVARRGALCMLVLTAAFAGAATQAEEPIVFTSAQTEAAAPAARRYVPRTDAGRRPPPGDDTIETDRPDFTEASSVVGDGVTQFELGYTFFYDDAENEDLITRTHSAPEILSRIGLNDWCELRVGWTYLWEEIDDAGVRSTGDGAADLYLGTKLFLMEQDVWIPEASLIVQGTAPTGAGRFSADHAEFGMNLLYGWDLIADWTCAGSTGFNTSREPIEDAVLGPVLDIDDHHAIFQQSFTVGIPITDRFRGYTEWFMLATTGKADEVAEHYFDGGFTYLATDDLQFDIRAGVGLNDDAQDFFVGSGLAFRFGK